MVEDDYRGVKRSQAGANVSKRRQAASSVGKLAPRCQLGSTNNLTKNSGNGWARSVPADIFKKASAYEFALAPLSLTARND
jgi:hypothetical protein